MGAEVYRRIKPSPTPDGAVVVDGVVRFEVVPDEPTEESGQRYVAEPGQIVANEQWAQDHGDVLRKYVVDLDSPAYSLGGSSLYTLRPRLGPEPQVIPNILDQIGKDTNTPPPQPAPTEAAALAPRPPAYGPHIVLMGEEHGDGGPFGPAHKAPPAAALPDPDDDAQPGYGVTVAVLDSGVYSDHPWMKGRLVNRRDQVDEDFDRDFHNGGKLRLPGVGHGTFVAGCIVQGAPGARVIARKVLKADGHTNDRELAEALEELARLDPPVDIVNLSLGGHTFNDAGLPFASAALDSLLRQGCVVVACAGNGSENEPFYPAAEPRVVAVGATELTGERAGFSNYGSWVDAYAPGVRIQSSFVQWLRKDGTPEPDNGPEPNKGPWAYWSGTSFAAPIVAGAIAATMRPNGAHGRHHTAQEAKEIVVGRQELPRPQDPGALVHPEYVVVGPPPPDVIRVPV